MRKTIDTGIKALIDAQGDAQHRNLEPGRGRSPPHKATMPPRRYPRSPPDRATGTRCTWYGGHARLWIDPLNSTPGRCPRGRASCSLRRGLRRAAAKTRKDMGLSRSPTASGSAAATNWCAGKSSRRRRAERSDLRRARVTPGRPESCFCSKPSKHVDGGTSLVIYVQKGLGTMIIMIRWSPATGLARTPTI